MKRKIVSLFFVVAIMVSVLGACAPYKGTTVVEIKPNQTAFLLPAQGDTTEQEKFDSVDYLKNRQVAAKIVEISYRQHKIGRMPWSVDFIPEQILIVVDRAPVSSQWTYKEDVDSSDPNQAIALESAESIGFYHGVVVNAVIEEADTATFLYYYGGAGSPSDSEITGIQLSVGLQNVMTSFVRTWVADELYAEFKARPLEQGQLQAGDIFAKVEGRAKENFKKYGITILSLGGLEGLVYDSERVQEAIDKKFEVAAAATSQAITNQRNIEEAEADAQVAIKRAEGEAQALQMTGEQLARYPSIVNKALADKSTGQVPQVLVMENSQDGTQTMPFPFWFYYPQPGQSTAFPTVTPLPTKTAVPTATFAPTPTP